MPADLKVHDTDLLSVAVRSISQFTSGFAHRFWKVNRGVAERRLRKLEQRGLLHGRTVLVSELIGCDSPLCLWHPGESSPNCGHVSYQAKRRWRTLPLKVRRVYYASTLGRALFGREPVKPPKDIQATHDVGLAAVYLEYLRRYRKLTLTCWRGESEYAHHRGRCVKVEDAMLCRDGKVLRLIDFAGAYRPDRVQALIEHAALHKVPIAIY